MVAWFVRASGSNTGHLRMVVRILFGTYKYDGQFVTKKQLYPACIYSMSVCVCVGSGPSTDRGISLSPKKQTYGALPIFSISQICYSLLVFLSGGL